MNYSSPGIGIFDKWHFSVCLKFWSQRLLHHWPRSESIEICPWSQLLFHDMAARQSISDCFCWSTLHDGETFASSAHSLWSISIHTETRSHSTCHGEDVRILVAGAWSRDHGFHYGGFRALVPALHVSYKESVYREGPFPKLKNAKWWCHWKSTPRANQPLWMTLSNLCTEW